MFFKNFFFIIASSWSCVRWLDWMSNRFCSNLQVNSRKFFCFLKNLNSNWKKKKKKKRYGIGTHQYDTSSKARAPAWCDRVLYRSVGKVNIIIVCIMLNINFLSLNRLFVNVIRVMNCWIAIIVLFQRCLRLNYGLK